MEMWKYMEIYENANDCNIANNTHVPGGGGGGGGGECIVVYTK